MYRFYIDDSQYYEDKICINGDDVNHISNVLRLNHGEWIVACNGNGTDYIGRITDISKAEVIMHVEKIQATGNELPVKMYLFQGIPKKDKMEFIIQKAVELGVYEIVPVEMNRCVAKISDDKKKEKKIARWQAIAMAAAKQCDRGIIPKVHEPVSFKQAIDMAKSLEYNMIPYELQEGMSSSKEIISKAVDKSSVGIFIGPEGGLEPFEVENALKEGIQPVTLGKRILRTETAGMVLLSILMYQIES